MSISVIYNSQMLEKFCYMMNKQIFVCDYCTPHINLNTIHHYTCFSSLCTLQLLSLMIYVSFTFFSNLLQMLGACIFQVCVMF
jgi:hypothetical protein